MTTETSTSRPAIDHANLRSEADRMFAEGDAHAAVDLLQGAYLDQPDPETASHLIDLRARAVLPGMVEPSAAPWPPTYDDPFPEVGDDRVPEVTVDSMSVRKLAGGVEHHGAVAVRGALSPDLADRVVEVILATEEHRDAPAGTPPPADRTYEPFNGIGAEPSPELLKLRQQRKMVAMQGGTWLADSPTGTAIALGALYTTGIVELMTEHFGARPCFSLQKSTLRRSLPEDKVAGWHQDGSFLGTDARTMNVWIALSDCGGEVPSPGLELIPKRVDEILPLDGGLGRVSISRETIAAASDHVPSIVPRFNKGDALIFDQYFVHRSYFASGMTEDRFALECWMFASGHTPSAYIPLLV